MKKIRKAVDVKVMTGTADDFSSGPSIALVE